MLSVTNQPFILSGVMLNVVMLSVVMLNVEAPGKQVNHQFYEWGRNVYLNTRSSNKIFLVVIYNCKGDSDT